MEHHYAPGATPLDPDEAAGLIPAHIATQGELNAWEEANIVEGERWALRQAKASLLEEAFIRELHRRMFGSTWRWAGSFRRSNKNIGVDWPQVATRLHLLLENTRYRADQSGVNVDALAVDFHHQLVAIHAFPNGNGRHARLLADLLALRWGRARFSWGGNASTLNNPGAIRLGYIQALRQADQGELEGLLRFARG